MIELCYRDADMMDFFFFSLSCFFSFFFLVVVVVFGRFIILLLCLFVFWGDTVGNRGRFQFFCHDWMSHDGMVSIV
jgi:hypothetical protein